MPRAKPKSKQARKLPQLLFDEAFIEDFFITMTELGIDSGIKRLRQVKQGAIKFMVDNDYHEPITITGDPELHAQRQAEKAAQRAEEDKKRSGNNLSYIQ